MNPANKDVFTSVLHQLEKVSSLNKGQKLSVHATTGDLAASVTNTTTWSGYALQHVFERSIGGRIGSYNQNWKDVSVRLEEIIGDSERLDFNQLSPLHLEILKNALQESSKKIHQMADYDYSNKPLAQAAFIKIVKKINLVCEQINAFTKNAKGMSIESKAKGLTSIQEKEISALIKSFLFPYITGRITPQNEPKDRKPLMEMIKEKFGSSKQVEQYAFQAYLEESASGLYVHCRVPKNKAVASTGGSFENLIAALKASLPKDFPGLIISEPMLRKLAASALERVTAIRLEGIQATGGLKQRR